MVDLIDTAAGRTAVQRMQARQQLIQVEGLEQIVIGTGLQAFDTVLDGVPRGENQNGQRLPAGPPASQQRHAVLVRKAQVKNANVEVKAVQCSLGGGGGANPVHRQTMQPQPRSDATGYQLVVFDQQEMQNFPPRTTMAWELSHSEIWNC